MLQEDLKQNRSPLSQEGMDFGAFPIAKYSQGLISGSGSDFEYFGKKLYWNYFGGEKNTVNQAYLKDKHDEIFFALIILTDVLDFSNENYNMAYSVISRNYPDKLGNGLLKTKNHSIEYTAFLTGDRKQFALVNLRLFDLDQGGLILIAPQKDGSLRSMQLEMPLLETKEIDRFIRSTIKSENVKNFFLAPGNI